MSLRAARETGADQEAIQASASLPTAPLPKPRAKSSRISTASAAKVTTKPVSTKPPRQRDTRGRWSQGGGLGVIGDDGHRPSNEPDGDVGFQAGAGADVSPDAHHLPLDLHNEKRASGDIDVDIDAETGDSAF